MSTPNNAEQLIDAAETADIANPDWIYPIIEAMPEWWQGYFTAQIETLGNSLSFTEEDFRGEITEVMCNCWRDQ